MNSMRQLVLVPLIVLATTLAAPAEIIDNAHMFDAASIKEAESKLERTEKLTHIPVRIETIESLRGADMDDVAQRKARQWDRPGLFVLIDKKEHKIQARDFHGIVGNRGDKEIRDAFTNSFKSQDFNGGLIKGVEMIGDVLATATPPPQRAGRRPVAGQFPPGQPQRQKSAFPWWATALIILAVLWIGMRVVGSLFGGNRMGQPMGGPGGGYPQGGPGYGGGSPGYGGGYGGRGGGFMSSLFGGIGGAMAGNWLYDQFSGRNHGSSMSPEQTNYDQGVNPADDPATGAWGGAETGDWGAGGGGDAGGGGGDWGGGGGDWGGGDGGGGGGDW